MIQISVSASKNYNVIMDQGLLSLAGSYIKDALHMREDPVTKKISNKKICIVTDATVNSLYGMKEQTLTVSLQKEGFEVYKFVFPGGEEHKNMATIAEILDFLADNKFSRSDLLLALGGGITGDITGFAAASYLRGVEYIQVPTTLLATVDSSVGGKTGVNLKSGKNLAGAFWQPSLVLFDPAVLETLSYDLKLDGIAESIKAGVIADPSIIIEACTGNISDTNGHQDEARSFGIISDQDDSSKEKPPAHPLTNDPNLLMHIAAKAIKVKRKVVEEDERDNGSRQLLNFGHTLAHAIEKCSSYSISHGHAVAIGMAIVSKASDKLGWSEEKCSQTIISSLKMFGFPLSCPYSADDLTEAALRDKKIRGDKITLVIPEHIGKCTLRTIPTDELKHFIVCGL